MRCCTLCPPVQAGTVSVQCSQNDFVVPRCARILRDRQQIAAMAERQRRTAHRAPVMVAATSSRSTTWARRSPAGTRPSQRSTSGTRTESSYSVCFHHRPRSPSWSPWSVV